MPSSLVSPLPSAQPFSTACSPLCFRFLVEELISTCPEESCVSPLTLLDPQMFVYRDREFWISLDDCCCCCCFLGLRLSRVLEPTALLVVPTQSLDSYSFCYWKAISQVFNNFPMAFNNNDVFTGPSLLSNGFTVTFQQFYSRFIILQ